MRSFFLDKISRLITRWPLHILIIAILLTISSLMYAYFDLDLNTDQDDLVSEEMEYHKRYKDYLDEFGDLEYLYIVIEVQDNLVQAKKFAKDVSEKLSKLEDIKEVTYKISNPVLEKSFLLYLTKQQLEQLSSFLSKGDTSLKNISKWNSLNHILYSMNNLISKPDPASEQEGMKSGFYFLDELLRGIDSTLKTGKPYIPSLTGAFLGTDQAFDEDGYLLTLNGKLLFVLIMPEKKYETLSVIEEPLRKIRDVLADTKNVFPDINAGLTGRPVLQADEMSVTNSDMMRATFLAILAATILFVLYFRRLTRPLMAIISLIFAISWTLGLTTLVIGYLNLLSTVFAVILVGAGIEFGLQIVSRYREELETSKNPTYAVSVCVTKTGRGNITAALTTAAAFFTALFTDFKALNELGFIAGFGILFCLLSLLIVLPTMMYLRDRNKDQTKLNTKLLLDLKGIDHLYRKPKLILVILTILTIAGLPGLKKLHFDHNLLNLQAEGLESVEYEKIIIDKSDESTWYAISITRTPLEARRIANQMKDKVSVGKVETYETIVPSEQKEKMILIAELEQSFKEATFIEPSTALNKNRMLHNLKILMQNLEKLTETAFSSGYVEAVNELENINKRVLTIYRNLQNTSPENIEALKEFQGIFIGEFQKGLKMLESGLSPQKIVSSDLPDSIRKRFISDKGNYATYSYPKKNIWEPQNMREFASDLRQVDPYVTGTPIEVFESSKLMQSSFQKAGIYAFLVILIIVLIDFRNPGYAVLSMIPLVFGIIWLLEVMGWAGIPFNLANFFAIPILLGVGVDNGVQIVHRYLQEGRDIKVMSKSTGAAVLLTSLTTGISFGMLILSSHRGIQSLGMIMALGALTCLIGSMILLPTILRLITRSNCKP